MGENKIWCVKNEKRGKIKKFGMYCGGHTRSLEKVNFLFIISIPPIHRKALSWVVASVGRDDESAFKGKKL